MNFRIRERSVTGQFRNEGIDDGTVGGRGWIIGDNATFTAGHVVYEWDRNRTIPRILFRPNTILYDEFNYGQNGNSIYIQEVNALIRSLGDVPSTRTNAIIEASLNLVSSDRVIIEGGGDTDSRDAGIVTFLNPQDLGNIGTIFSYTTPTVTRYGDPTGNVAGTFNDVDRRSSGIVEFSGTSEQGDSGSAYLLNLPIEGKGFVAAIQSSNSGTSGDAIATYFTHDAWININEFLQASQRGNVTQDEPTNLIVGSTSVDTGSGRDGSVNGSYRADIILGRDGNDVLNDGDSAFDFVYADDQLFGGAGDDRLIVGAGNNLIHGGDFRQYGGNQRVELVDDGVDTADFGGVSNGIEIRFPIPTANNPSSASNPQIDRRYQSILGDDFNSALFVSTRPSLLNLEPSAANTLVSIEKIKGSDVADTLFIDSDSFATGGISEIDFGGNFNLLRRPNGDGIVFGSGVTTGVTVDLRNAENQTISGSTLVIKNAENIIGTSSKDILYAVNPAAGENLGLVFGSVIGGGAGDDDIYGGTGADYLAGGAGDDDIFVGAGDTALGGAGRDVFHLVSSDSFFNNVLILDFNPEEDSILLNGQPLVGFQKTTVLQELVRQTSADGSRIATFDIQTTTSNSAFNIVPLRSGVNGPILSESEEITLYQNGQYRDIIVGATSGISNSGRITYIDANIDFGPGTVNSSEGAINLVSNVANGSGVRTTNVSLNSYISIFFGDSGGFQNGLFSHTRQGDSATRASLPLSGNPDAINIGRIIERNVDTVTSNSFFGFQSDGLESGSSIFLGDPSEGIAQFFTASVSTDISFSSFRLGNGANVQLRPDISSLFSLSDAGNFSRLGLELGFASALDDVQAATDSGLLDGSGGFSLSVLGLSGETAGQFVKAKDGGDSIAGTDKSDYLLGSSANDTLVASSNDPIVVTSRSPSIASRALFVDSQPEITDILIGGQGDDIYEVDANTSNVVITDGLQNVALGGGFDRVIANFAWDSVQISTSANGRDVILTVSNGTKSSRIIFADLVAGAVANQIEEIEFSDGVVINRGDLLAALGIISVTFDALEMLEDELIDVELPENLFFDPQGRSFDVVAELQDGSPLPVWLIFDGMSVAGSPPPNFNGSIGIRFTATAEDGATASTLLNVNISPVNDTPQVNLALADIQANEGDAISFTLPEDAFIDVDGDDLTFTAALADGNDLPAWLIFDGTSFTGHPPADFTGSFVIEVTASDESLSTVQRFNLSIDPINNAPLLAAPLADVSVTEDTVIDILLPAGSFADVDGDGLTLSATLANGDALPNWLSFDAAASRFTGLPPANFTGAINVRVTASDGALSVSDDFQLTLAPVNDAPAVVAALTDRVSAEDSFFDFTLPAGSFTDFEGTALNYAATLADGTGLPSWLSFDAATQRFTGTPPANFSGAIDLIVTASDGELAASDAFRLTIDPVNDVPAVLTPLLDISRSNGTPISFAVPAGAFGDLDGDILTLSAALASGAALPAWLTFANGAFSGTPPLSFVGTLDIAVTATDPSGATVSDVFALAIMQSNRAPVANNDTGLTTQTNSPLVIQASALLANDSDPDGNALSLATVDNAVGGSVVINGQGQVVYTPNAGFQGTGSFSYSISDGNLTASANVAVEVQAATTAFLFGTPGNDNLNGAQNAANRINGLAGNDNINGGVLGDHLIGGAGNDQLVGNAGDDILDGGTGNDRLFAGSGNDTLSGGDGNDQLVGDGGNDSLIGDNGNDQLNAGEGNDSLDGGNGNDVLTGDNGNDILVGGDGNDQLFAGQGNDVLNGGSGNDRVHGDDGDDILTGGIGNDTIDGGGGIDTVDFAYLTTNLTINLHNNTAFTAGENDIINNIENVIAGSGNDSISGNGAANILNGGNGNDILTGGAGNDTLLGGIGTDTAVFAGLVSSYSIVTSGGGIQVIDNQPGTNGNDGTDTLVGIERLQFRGGATVSLTAPIVIDLDGNGVETVSAADSNARYDLDGDGLTDDTSWIGNADGFLFLDRDGNGTVTNAGEFSFVDDLANARSDLEGLRAFDSNGDGSLSALDARFAEFRIWRDRDGDGAAENGEILTLATAGLRSLNLTGTPVESTVTPGEVAILNMGSFTRTNGTTGTFADAALTFFSSAGGQVAPIAMQNVDYGRKSKKYHLTSQGGELFVTLKKARGTVDDRAGRISGAAVLSFRGRRFGLFSPIVLDLDGNGIELVKQKKSKAWFDLDGNGTRDDTGWVGGGDGFLVIDRNNDGLINSSAELSFFSENADAASSFGALRTLDNNNDGILNASDVRFGELRVWVDTNGNGVTDTGELRSLEQAGIVSFDLRTQAVDQTVKLGTNIVVSTASFTRANGTTNTAGEVALAFNPDSRNAPNITAELDAQDEISSGGARGGNDSPEIPRWLYDVDFDAFAAFGDGLRIPSLINASTAEEFTQGQSIEEFQNISASVVRALSNDNSLPDPSDALRVALMVQDMASFDAKSAAEIDRRSRFGDGVMDYFVA